MSTSSPAEGRPAEGRGPRFHRRLALGLLLAVVAGGLALGSVPTKRPPDPERGRTLYRESCWQCHGFTGEGKGPTAGGLSTVSPPLAGRLAEADYERLVQVILEGKGDMPAFAAVMDRHDAKRILIWLGTLDPENPHDPADDAPQDKKDKDAEKADEDATEAGGGEGGD